MVKSQKNPKNLRIRIQIRMTSKIQWWVPCPKIHLWRNFRKHPVCFCVKLLTDREINKQTKWKHGVINNNNNNNVIYRWLFITYLLTYRHSAVLTATSEVNGKGRISPPPLQNRNKSIAKKCGTVNKVRRTTQHAKFGENPFTKNFRANGRNITLSDVHFIALFFFLLSDTRKDQTLWWILTHNG